MDAITGLAKCWLRRVMRLAAFYAGDEKDAVFPEMSFKKPKPGIQCLAYLFETPKFRLSP